MILIDGSQGEGGGQILRSALALSLLTGQAVRIENIRAKRPKPGLQPQHLAAVRVAAAIARAETAGAELGSTRLDFRPGRVRPGTYSFEIGTAGAVTLVLQTVFLPLALADAASTLFIGGGTHVPWSPSFEYIAEVWLPMLQRLGLEGEVALERAGFYPRGGGRIRAHIEPTLTPPTPLVALERGAVHRVTGISAVANLPLGIAERQARQAEKRLRPHIGDVRLRIETLNAPGPGTALFLRLESEHAVAGFVGLGARGKPAERVADEAVDELLAHLATPAAIDPHLADQLILPLALARGRSAFRTSAITNHLLTHVAVVRAFLPATIAVEGELGAPGKVIIEGVG
ncbi:MAG: RNA 3'-terminal phosphate cyclase [Anaerolineae bacterium]|nr:RNA 3'-terminal phosphate cyclase [Caldilineales bacterium]MDW8268396.1 RNA 3'-terminal phosphate cyclase [Anaerolineae bacterium]